MSQGEKTFRLFISANGQYRPILTACVRSILDNYRSSYPIELHIAALDFPAEDRRAFTKDCEDERLTVEWHEYGDGQIPDDLPETAGVHSTFFPRLVIDRYLPGDEGQILCMDSDLLVLDDLGELSEIQIEEGKVLAAVTDYKFARLSDALYRSSAERRAKEGQHFFFNGGLLLMNLREWRSGDYGEQIMRLLREDPEMRTCAELTAFNYVLREKWQPLPLPWNDPFGPPSTGMMDRIARTKKERELLQSKIIHFYRHKPWSSSRYTLFLAPEMSDAFREFAKRPRPPAGWRTSLSRWLAEKTALWEKMSCLRNIPDPAGNSEEATAAVWKRLLAREFWVWPIYIFLRLVRSLGRRFSVVRDRLGLD